MKNPDNIKKEAADRISRSMEEKYGGKNTRTQVETQPRGGIPESRKVFADHVTMKMESRYDPSVEVNEYDVRSFLADTGSFLNSYQKDYESMGYANASSLYQSRRSAWESLTQRGEQLYDLLKENPDFLGDEGNKSFRKYLADFRNAATNQNLTFKQGVDYYSQWETEEDYNNYSPEMLRSFDVAEGEKEIARLENILTEYQSLSRWETDEKGRARAEEIRSQYGNEEQIKGLISEKTAYMNRASRFQEGEKLSSVGQENSEYYAQDFGQLSVAQSDVEDVQYRYINDAVYRTAYQRMLNGAYDNFHEAGLDIMTEDEKGIYNYYYARDGKEKAQEYLNSIRETLNHRRATGIYEDLEDNTLLELAFGVAAGIDQFQGGMRSLLWNSEGEYVAPSAKQMASGMVREDLADVGGKLPEWMGGASFGQAGYDAITTTANMAPSIMTSMGMNILLPGSGAAVGTAMMGASAAGNAYQEMLNLGYDKNQARGYSLLVGSSEAILGYALSGISALGGKVTGNVLSKMLNGVDNAFLHVGAKILGNMASEGLEEGLQEILTPWFQNLMMHTGEDINWNEVAYSTLLGALTAGFMEGGGTVTQGAKDYRTGTQLQEKKVDVGRLKEIGQTFAADTVAYQLAGRVNENTGAYTLGRMFNEIGATLTEQNISEITEALVQEGMSQTVARKNAEAMAAVVEGEALTDTQRQIIEGNDVLARAARTTIFDENSTVYQRTVGYNETLMAMAQEMAAQTDTAQQGGENVIAPDAVEGQAETAAENSAEVKADSKVKEIVSLKDGTMKLRLEDGSEVSGKEANYASRGEALIYETVAEMTNDAEAANLLVNVFHSLNKKSALDAEVYAAGIEEAFRYGKANIPTKELVTSDFASKLSDIHRNYAYRMGQHHTGLQVAKEQAAVKKAAKRTAGKESFGKVHFDRKGRTFDTIREASLKTMEQLSASLGVEFHVYESYVNEDGQRVYKYADGNEVSAPNGFYDPESGAIHIDLNAGQEGKGTMLFTAAHELTHFIKQWSPAKFKVLANFLVKQYGEKGVSVSELVQQQMDKAKQNGRSLTWDDAYEEMIADSMETMLNDGNVVQVMADLKAQDKSLWQKIRDWFKDLAADLRKMVDAYRGVKPDTAEGRMVADMQDVIGVLESLYEDALADASDSFQRAEKNTAPEGGVNNDAAVKRSERIVDQIRKSLSDIMALDSVYEIDESNAVPYTSDRKTDEKSGNDVFKAQGGVANRPGFGRVILSKRGAIHTVHHGNGPAKQASFPAIKAVIEQGIEIYRDIDHDGRGFDTVTFSAPITFFGEAAPLATVVKSFDSPNADKTFYIHEICDAEGNYIQLGEDASTEKNSSTNFAEPTSAVNAADNGISPKTSIRNSGEKVNKKFSDRDPAAGRVNQVLQKENAQLKEDVQYLRDLVKLQRTVTGGTKFTKSSVETMAGQLMKANNARGSKTELAKLLNELYEYIAKGEELTWEGVTEMAQPAVEWLRSHTVIKSELSEYAKEILYTVRSSRIALDESQTAEAAYRYGSFNDYRKAMMGSVVIAKDGVPLDIQWQEWASTYPDVFDADITASDMPDALVDVIASLRSSDLSRAEYAYHADMIAQDLLQQVYDGYWKVSTLYTVADVKQREINALKGKHHQKMNDLRQFHRDKTAQLKQEHREEVKRIRKEYRENSEKKQREIMDRYQQSRKKAVEGRNKTAMRHKIQNVVKELNSLLLNESKSRHVPEELQKAVAEALDAVNMDTVGAEERIAKLQAEMMKAKTPEKVEEVARKIENVRKMGDRMNDRLQKLKAAYDQLTDSEDPLFANAHDDVISAKLEAVIKSVGDTPLRDMTMNQLEDVYDMYRVVLTTIRNANKTFKQAKAATITEMGTAAIQEIRKVGGETKQRVKGSESISAFGWNGMKPVYAFERIGSKTMAGLFDSVRKGEDTWARDVSEARSYYLDMGRKYGYEGWALEEQHSFTSASGMDFRLNLEQIMSLYAYSKRKQAAEHLRKGGIVFDPGTEVVEKTKYGIKVKYDVTEATAYNISPDTLAEIVGTLSDEQKGFVDEMQEYLSSTMGGKGNEVSMELYGVKLFKEKHYFPLKSAAQYMAKAKEQAQGEVKIKNSGFSKETVTKASNPIVLSGFMDVWANHVNEMSMYHAFVLPMEDFYRVYNFKTPVTDTGTVRSVDSALQNAYGKGATKYIDQLLKDLNGGVRVDATTDVINKLTGKFKKGAVFASLSVVVQQPSAIARAAALVDTKYFIGPKVDKQRHKALWEEVKRYAPVAVIKEMGYFDTNMGKSTKDYIIAKEYSGFSEKMKALIVDGNYRDEVLSKAPALADELGWCSIWEAVKRETKDKHPGMDIRSEAFLKAAGERFSEVIVKTQVYDSVLSRSAMMRSKDTGMKMATAFMAEPTTSINMIADALIQGKRGKTKYCRTTIGAVVASQILNSILVSFVYAARDDDENETYMEKYLSSLTSEVFDSLNPLTYIPFIKDIVSICRGYTVERSDMAIISDLYEGFQALRSTKKTPWQKVEKFGGSVAQLFGLPLKNIMRDIRAIYQTIHAAMGGDKTTSAGLGYAFKSGLPGWLGGGDTSDREQLYNALLKGDQAQIQRVAGRYEDQDAAESAMRSAIKDHYIVFDIDAGTAMQYMADFCDMTEDEAYWKLREWDYAIEYGSSEGYAKYGDFLTAVQTGEDLETVIKQYTDNGVELKTLKSQITTHFKPLYLEMSKSDKAGIREKLLDAMELCGDTREDAEEKIGEWGFESEYGFENNDTKQLFIDGKITEAQALEVLTEHRGYETDYARDTIDGWKFESDHPELAGRISFSQYQRWEEEGKANGVSVDLFTDVAEYRDDGVGGKYKSQDEVAAYINSLPITNAQKDALWLCFWSKSTLRKAPWN